MSTIKASCPLNSRKKEQSLMTSLLNSWAGENCREAPRVSIASFVHFGYFLLIREINFLSSAVCFLGEKNFTTKIIYRKVSFASEEFLGSCVQVMVEQCQNRWLKYFLDHQFVTPFWGSEFSSQFRNGKTKLLARNENFFFFPSVLGEGLIPAITIFLAWHK